MDNNLVFHSSPLHYPKNTAHNPFVMVNKLHSKNLPFANTYFLGRYFTKGVNYLCYWKNFELNILKDRFKVNDTEYIILTDYLSDCFGLVGEDLYIIGQCIQAEHLNNKYPENKIFVYKNGNYSLASISASAKYYIGLDLELKDNKLLVSGQYIRYEDDIKDKGSVLIDYVDDPDIGIVTPRRKFRSEDIYWLKPEEMYPYFSLLFKNIMHRNGNIDSEHLYNFKSLLSWNYYQPYYYKDDKIVSLPLPESYIAGFSISYTLFYGSIIVSGFYVDSNYVFHPCYWIDEEFRELPVPSPLSTDVKESLYDDGNNTVSIQLRGVTSYTAPLLLTNGIRFRDIYT